MFNFWPFNIFRKQRGEAKTETVREFMGRPSPEPKRNTSTPLGSPKHPANLPKPRPVSAAPVRTTGNTLARQPAATHRSAPQDDVSSPAHPLSPLNPWGVYSSSAHDSEPSRSCDTSYGSSDSSSSSSSCDSGSSSSD